MFAEIPTWFDWVFIIGVTPGSIAAVIYGLVSRKQSLRSRIGGVCVGVLMLGGVVFTLLYDIPQKRAKQVIRECMAASDALQKSPPGLARVDEFIRRIRSIDTRGAPEDLVTALHDHADAMAQAEKAARTGSESKQLDDQIAAAKERFAAAVRKYW